VLQEQGQTGENGEQGEVLHQLETNGTQGYTDVFRVQGIEEQQEKLDLQELFEL
jgi:hypothetical protein